MLSSIDGSILLDEKGVCHAIGVILDGLASEKCTPSRGARFNSSIRYIEQMRNKKTPCMSIVVSEDGHVDLMPRLRPRIERAELTRNISVYKEESLKTSPVFRRLRSAERYLDENRFYLSPEDCDEVNTCRERVQELRKRNADMGDIILSVEPFTPDSEFDESYFI